MGANTLGGCSDLKYANGGCERVIDASPASFMMSEPKFETTVSFQVIADSDAIAIASVDAMNDPKGLQMAMAGYSQGNVTLTSVTCSNCDMIIENIGLPIGQISLGVAGFSAFCCLVAVIIYWFTTGGMPNLISFGENPGLKNPPSKKVQEPKKVTNPMFMAAGVAGAVVGGVAGANEDDVFITRPGAGKVCDSMGAGAVATFPLAR